MNVTSSRSRISSVGVIRPTRVKQVDLFISALVDKTSSIAYLDRLYQTLPPARDITEFLETLLQLFHIGHALDNHELGNIPRQGPVVVVANHPFGAIEGVLIARVLHEIRKDVRIMANHLLTQFSELKELFIGVDPFGGRNAARHNLKPLRESIRWVKDGGLLVIFPAGEVSHLRLRDGVIADPPWNPAVASIVRTAKATVVPVFFHGHNSMAFNIFGLLHPRLRTVLLPRELLKKSHQTIRLHIGEPVKYSTMPRFGANEEMTAYLRLHTYLLGEVTRPPSITPAVSSVSMQTTRMEPVVNSPHVSILKAEIEKLPPAQILVTSDEWRVLYARGAQIPWLLQEIGRLREITFRAVGEGTGRTADIDLYDDYYLHLFLWNTRTLEVAGAYRLGLCNEIVPHFGLRGLYTYSLFRYKRSLIDALTPALELGRSFVRIEYQRSFAPLMLLWKGIGEFVARHPRYRVLFGPVSISNDYQPLTRALLVDYLKSMHFERELARHVKPRQPFRYGNRPLWRGLDLATLGGIDTLDRLIRDIEPDGKNSPVLIRHYLKLGGRFLGFNVDAQFGNALDGLVMVDLRQTDPRLLTRYMGQEGAQRFIRHHSSQPALCAEA